MDSLYTILWDPNFTGDFEFYNKFFYSDSSDAMEFCDKLNSDLYNSLSESSLLPYRFKVFKVDFTEFN